MITVTMTPEQAKVVAQALDHTLRMKLGQLVTLVELFLEKPTLDADQLDTARELCMQLKRVLFPGFGDNSGYGVGSPELTRSDRIMYEALKVFEHAVWKCGDRSVTSVASHDPYILNFSGTPRITFSIQF